MNRFAQMIGLAFAAMLFSSTGLATDKWSPFTDDSQKVALTPVPCAEGAGEYRQLQRFSHVAANDDVQLVFVPEAEKWSLRLKMNGTQYMPHVYSDQNLSMGVNGVYARDLNGDGLTDFIVDLVNGGFCGLDAGLRQMLIILPRKNGAPVVYSFWTYSAIKDSFVDLDGDGLVEAVIADLVQEVANDSIKHSYWVYDRYEFVGMDMIPVRINDWPEWIWFDGAYEHLRDAPQFTSEEKDAMWAEHLRDRETVKTTELTVQ